MGLSIAGLAVQLGLCFLSFDALLEEFPEESMCTGPISFWTLFGLLLALLPWDSEFSGFELEQEMTFKSLFPLFSVLKSLEDGSSIFLGPLISYLYLGEAL